MQRHIEHREGDRYQLDSELAGFAQIDSSEDAPYYGNWASAERLQLVSFTEGEVCVTACDGPDEFKAEVLRVVGFLQGLGTFRGIDPRSGGAEAWDALGLGELLGVRP